MGAVRELFRTHRNAVADLKEAQKNTGKDLVKFVGEKKIDMEQVGIGELFDVLVGEGLKARGVDFDRRYSDFDEIKEEMVSSTFPYITGKLIQPTLIEAYELDTADIRSLFRVMPSNKRTEDIAGTTDAQRPRHVEEGEPYPEAQMTEKRVQISNHKFGHGMGLTVEMVKFDQTGELLNRAKDSGTGIADLFEEFACYRLSNATWTELNESANSCMIYNGTGVDMYADTHATVFGYANDNLVASGNAAPSISQLQTMTALLANMKTENNRPVRIRPRVIFGHAQMADKFEQFFNRQEYDLDSAERNVNIYKGKYRIVTSQFFPNTSYWFLGDPERQFRIQWVWEPKVTVQDVGDPKRDILVNFWVSMYVGIGAVDFRYVVRNNG